MIESAKQMRIAADGYISSLKEAEELREEYSEQWEKQRGWKGNEIFEAFFVTLIVTAPALIVVLGVRSWIIG